MKILHHIVKHKRSVERTHATLHIVYWVDAAVAVAHGPVFSGVYLTLACLTFMVAYIQEHE